MLCKCYWIVLYIVHFTAFCLGGGRFFPDTVYITIVKKLRFFVRKHNLFTPEDENYVIKRSFNDSNT